MYEYAVHMNKVMLVVGELLVEGDRGGGRFWSHPLP